MQETAPQASVEARQRVRRPQVALDHVRPVLRPFPRVPPARAGLPSPPPASRKSNGPGRRGALRRGSRGAVWALGPACVDQSADPRQSTILRQQGATHRVVPRAGAPGESGQALADLAALGSGQSLSAFPWTKQLPDIHFLDRLDNPFRAGERHSQEHRQRLQGLVHLPAETSIAEP